MGLQYTVHVLYKTMSLSVYEVRQACCEQQAIGSQVWGEAQMDAQVFGCSRVGASNSSSSVDSVGVSPMRTETTRRSFFIWMPRLAGGAHFHFDAFGFGVEHHEGPESGLGGASRPGADAGNVHRLQTCQQMEIHRNQQTSPSHGSAAAPRLGGALDG